MSKHEFGLIEHFEEGKWYIEYAHEKYHCVSVDMDIMDKIIETRLEEFKHIKTYACISAQPFQGLDESGITLIPPESLKEFCEVIIKVNDRLKEPQLFALIEKVQEAMRRGKYLIHFGI